MKIGYIEGNEELLDLLKPMWEKLNLIHKSRSLYFKDRYEKLIFAERKSILLKKAEAGMVRVDLAVEEGNTYVGYCIGSIVGDKAGDIDSLYVEPGYRNAGIGGCLVERMLRWMDGSGVLSKTVTVAVGNEEVFSFYSRYGFYSSANILMQR
ncbi:MAG: hypothetical protein JL50_05470 [Peptococcaceae bacterium BICA1-7]|nr:MAG: hypothetical protein JL50_05470 [Peptococcaceae bacterium BICA1-7]